MNEEAAASLALDAYSALQGIGQDVAQIKGQNSDVLDALGQLVARDGAQPIAQDLGEWQTVVTSSVEVPADFFPGIMGFQYMQTVLFVFVLVAMLLNLGATLWLAFSDKWRS